MTDLNEAQLVPIAARATSELIAEQLRELVAVGTFPAGTQVNEVSLAAGLGVSRGPVREGIQRLVQEGLLRYERNRGLFVPVMTVADLRDIVVARRGIEMSACALVVDLGSEDLCRDLDALVYAMSGAPPQADEATLDRWGLEFHLKIVEASRSPRLLRSFKTLTVELRMCRALLRLGHHGQALIETHRGIIEALRAGDLSAIGAAFHTHDMTMLDDARRTQRVATARDPYRR